MEKLKSLVPETLKQIVADSNPDDLQSTSSSLHRFLMNLPQFDQMVRDLTDMDAALCAKNKEKALELKQKANKCYMNGDYAIALACYSQALRVAPEDATDLEKNLVATLYLNRASVLHKIGLFVECIRDCNRALEISPCYAKAWYRRGKVNAALGHYEDAVLDFKVAENVESSPGGKMQIECELQIILNKIEGSSSRLVQHADKSLGNLNELPQTKLLSVTSPDKGRGLASPSEIPPASLVHVEEPFGLVILKSCRDTHCHYCLNELPADAVPCLSCSIPLYCSQRCREHAGGETINHYKTKDKIDENLPSNLKEYIVDVISCSDSGPDAESFPEHKHECLGVHWPAVFPSDIVLAGRILAKSVYHRRYLMDSNLLETLELSHCYPKMNPEDKLELHIYAIVLLHCLQHPFGFELPINGVSLSQIIILISQIRVNAMAVVYMKSIDVRAPPDQFRNFSYLRDASTSSVEQVSVGQAIYRTGSLFNHSCQPNIHAYFLSRTLFVRTTELVAPGCPLLELSYGPQVGKWDCKDRLKFLEDRYSFRCQCSGCSRLNPSDLVISAFHCVDSNCDGVVLDSCVINTELRKLESIPQVPETQKLDPYSKVDDLQHVACFAHELSSGSPHVRPGFCLNCGSPCNLESLRGTMTKSWIYIQRLQDAVVSEEVSTPLLSDALRALGILRSILHVYNKQIAEANDILAQAFCQLGDFQSAQDHCEASIKILEMLYGPNDIVIGYELVKLSTIQLSLGEPSALETINRLGAIFTQYYGSHADSIFPYLQMLNRESCNLSR